MLKVEMKPVIDVYAICRHFGTHWSDYEFSQEAKNGSYQVVCCDNITLNFLQERLVYEQKKESSLTVADFENEDEWQWHKRHSRANRLQNQIALVEYLREQGYSESVLIHVYW